jgi:hypothetical protein
MSAGDGRGQPLGNEFQDACQVKGGISRNAFRPGSREWDIWMTGVEILWIANFTTDDLSP